MSLYLTASMLTKHNTSHDFPTGMLKLRLLKAETNSQREGLSKLESFFRKFSIRWQGVLSDRHCGRVDFRSLKPLVPLYLIIPVFWLYLLQVVLWWWGWCGIWNCRSHGTGTIQPLGSNSPTLSTPMFPLFLILIKTQAFLCVEIYLFNKHL